MANSRKGRAAIRAAAPNTSRGRQAIERYDDGKSFFGGSGGRWATAQMKKAINEGRDLSAQEFRSLDTLRHEEWKYFDDVLIREALIRLVGVADLISAGLTVTVPNAMGKLIYDYEKITDLGEADVSLDGLSETPNDLVEFSLNGLPLPITHKDFFINLRKLAASRNKGEPLDTTQVALAGRVVAEKAEKMLFQGGKTFGGLPIYGYTTFPSRISSVTFDGGNAWSAAGKLGASFVADVIAASNALVAQRMYGPYMIYVPGDAGVNLSKDYNAATANTQTIYQRLLAMPQVAGIRVADQLPTAHVIFVQMTPENVVWVQGEPLQTIQWDEYGGMKLNFKAMQIAVPLLRSTAAGRCGILDLHA